MNLRNHLKNYGFLATYVKELVMKKSTLILGAIAATIFLSGTAVAKEAATVGGISSDKCFYSTLESVIGSEGDVKFLYSANKNKVKATCKFIDTYQPFTDNAETAKIDICTITVGGVIYVGTGHVTVSSENATNESNLGGNVTIQCQAD
jgi:hypothetical protein